MFMNAIAEMLNWVLEIWDVVFWRAVGFVFFFYKKNYLLVICLDLVSV